MRIDHHFLSCNAELLSRQYLTDGGVHDNLGIEALIHHTEELDAILISDAGSIFEQSADTQFRMIVGRNVRASEILMNRVGILHYRLASLFNKKIIPIRIGQQVQRPDDPMVADLASQRLMGKIRTDLDTFTNKEVASLIYHGYCCARDELTKKEYVHKSIACSWAPLGRYSGTTAPKWNNAEENARSQKKRLRLFSKDATGIINVLIILAWALMASAPYFHQYVDLAWQSYAAARDLVANEGTSRYLKKTGAPSILVFVHGPLTNSLGAWTCAGNMQSLPALSSSDPELGSYDIYLVGYNSKRPLDVLWRQVYFQLSSDKVLNYASVFFVTQTFGADLVRSMILNNKTNFASTKKIITYAEVELPWLIETTLSFKLPLLSWMPEFGLEMLGDDAISKVRRHWKSEPHIPPTSCATPTHMPSISFTPYVDACSMPATPISGSIDDIAKPCTGSSALNFLKWSLNH